MSWLNLHKKKKLLSDKPCWTFTPPMIHSLKSHALSSCSVVLSISPYLVNFDIVHGYDKYINSLYSNLLLHSRMLHDPKTVIGRDFDQETAEKIAPPFIARLELANCMCMKWTVSVNMGHRFWTSYLRLLRSQVCRLCKEDQDDMDFDDRYSWPTLVVE